MIQLVAFLGNPGRQYEQTRHNMPWLLLKHFSFSGGLRWTRKFKGEYAEHTGGGGRIFLHKPLTLMNKSGVSVSAITAFFKIPPERVLVIHDEVELEFGEVSLKFGGGLAGHNGLRSTAGQLGTRDFYRLRIGVGRPRWGTVSSHVLGKLTDHELGMIAEMSSATETIIEELLRETAHPSGLLDRYRRYGLLY